MDIISEDDYQLDYFKPFFAMVTNLASEAVISQAGVGSMDGDRARGSKIYCVLVYHLTYIILICKETSILYPSPVVRAVPMAKHIHNR